MTSASPRKGTSRVADMSPEVKMGLEAGTLETATLSESLGMEQGILLRNIFPDAGEAVFAAVDRAAEVGILARMHVTAEQLLARYGAHVIAHCASHPSDMVRGWACFMIGKLPDMVLEARLQAIRPLADDSHFGVREWVWMGVRGHLEAELPQAIALLTPWAHAPSENIRRFACESIRPRGVWCSHIKSLKDAPEQALHILTALKADSSLYVQNSVANWLNDAGKSQASWVKALCEEWMKKDPTAATVYICTRAQRNLK